MKNLLIIACLLGGAGCSTQKNLTALVKALGNDPATVNIRVTSVYGTMTFTRTNPTTNSLPHTINPDGTVTVAK
jgi:hypothetical protein